ncbi:MAG: gluconate 2-dehydrogenase subunit 3 family protein, partial [Gemmatimonadaceae bacterium]
MPSNDMIGEREMITRREAVLRVSALLGGVALVGGSALLTGCRPESTPNTDAPFTADEIAFLDEVADTILPETSTPGAKAAKTGAFMALMVTDTYDARDREVFRKGIPAIDEATQKAHKVTFMKATPQQRLAVLEALDRDQKTYMEARAKAEREKAAASSSDQGKEEAQGARVSAATAITENPPAHYFRMMKELALLGYFTSEIGYTKAMRYVETPGRYEPCVAYKPGEKAWA